MSLVKTTAIISSETDLQTFLKSVEYRVVRNKEELKKSCALVYNEYIKRGYMEKNFSGLRISIYNAFPQTTTFIAIVEHEVIATATIIPDLSFGLPMETTYHEELERFRKENKKICEISMLASDTDLFSSGASMMLQSKKMFFIFFLFKLIFDYAKNILNLDNICITINPKHNLTYDFLLFKNMGGLKTYCDANGAPAIAKSLDLNSIEKECQEKKKEGIARMFFRRKTDPEKFSGKFMFSLQDLKYFFTEKTDIFKNATPFQLDCLKRCYPAYDFSTIIP
ncbi:MAG: hypothetical protein KAS99_04010 [Candidatus Omnitrophica bacterium]|nr:hypothetical protein [Candidatus Omnitrophota bacterium]